MKVFLVISLLLSIIFAQQYTALFKLQNGFKDTTNSYTLLRTNTSNNSQQDGRLPNTKAYKLNLMDYYYLPDNLVNQISGDFTIALWNKLEPNTYRNDFQIFQLKFNNIIFHLEQNSFWIDNQRIYIDVPSSKEDLWYHVAVTFKQNTVTVYIQGQKVFERKNQNYDKLTYVRICNAYIGLVQDIAVYNFAVYERSLIDIQNIGDDTVQDYTRGLLEYYPISGEFTYNDTIRRQSGDRYIVQLNSSPTQKVIDRLTRQTHAVASTNQQQLYPSSSYTINRQQRSYSFMVRIQINNRNAISDDDIYFTIKSANRWLHMPKNMDLRYFEKYVYQAYVITASLSDDNSKILFKFYIDGQLIDQETIAITNSTFEISQVLIGSSLRGKTFSTDDIAVWDRELTFTEIQQLSKLDRDIVPYNYQSFYTPNQQDCENMYKNYFKVDKFDYDFEITGWHRTSLKYELKINEPNFKFIPGCFYPSLAIGGRLIDIPVIQENQDKVLVAYIESRYNNDRYPLCDYSFSGQTTCDFQFILTYKGNEILRKQLSSHFKQVEFDSTASDIFSVSDEPTIVKALEDSFNPRYNLCKDRNCNSYKQQKVLVENQVNYIELKIDSSQYHIKINEVQINGEKTDPIAVYNDFKGSVIIALVPYYFTQTFKVSADYTLTLYKP